MSPAGKKFPGVPWMDMRIPVFFVLLGCLSFLPAQDSTVKLSVDATDAPRRLFHVRISMPAKPGPMTLLYPKWIPGEHMPTGPITHLVGLRIKAGEQTISWKRDSVNMFAFHINVPVGAPVLDIVFDYISRSEEHTSELQSHSDLVCRLLLEKKKIYIMHHNYIS